MAKKLNDEKSHIQIDALGKQKKENNNIYNYNNIYNNNFDKYDEDEEESNDPYQDIESLIRNDYNRYKNNSSTNNISINNINNIDHFFSQKNNRKEEIEQKGDIKLKEEIDQKEDTELKKEKELKEDIKQNLKEEKKIYLSKIKEDLKIFKNKCKVQYSKNEDNISYNVINNYQLNDINESDLNEQLNKYEIELKNKMKNELKNFKNNLYEKMNDSNSEDNDILLDLELNKERLESEIRIQKKRNDFKIKEIKKTKIESKERIYALNNTLNTKKSAIDSRYNIKESKLKQKYKNDINNYINDKIRNQNQLNYSLNIINKSYNFQIDEMLSEYEKELNEINELKKKDLEEEFNQQMEKELKEFKLEKMDEIERNINKVENSKLKLEKDYIANIGIKSISINIQKDHIDDLYKLIIENISSYQKVINNKCTKDGEDEFRKLKKLFQKTLNDALNGLYKEEMYIEGILKKNKSRINLLKEDILNTQIYIEYFSKIFSSINKIFDQKNNIFNSVSINDKIFSDKDDFLIDEIITIVNNINNEFNFKKDNYFINSKLNEFFNNLENEYNKRNDSIFNNEEEQSINNQFFHTMNFNNNNFNLFSKESFTPNRKYNNTGRNRFFSASINKNIKSNTNMNLYETVNKENWIRKNTDFDQSIFNSINEDNNIIKDADFSINNSLSLNNNNSIPRLPTQILNSFSKELYNNYKYILQFIMFEYSNLNYAIQDYNSQKKANKTLKDLKNGIGNYYKVLYAIYNQEKKISLENKMEIEIKLKAYNNIKKYCEEIFNNICISNSYRNHRIIYEKFNEIIINIKFYYKKNYQKIIYMNNNNNYLDVNLEYFNTFQNGLNTAKNNLQYNNLYNFKTRGISYDKRTLNQKKIQNNW